MQQPLWPFGCAALAAVAFGVLIGVDSSWLPRHGGWGFAALLFVAGAVFGLRAVVLPFLGTAAWAVVAGVPANGCEGECHAWEALLTVIPAVLCVPVLAGVLMRALSLGATRLRHRID